MLIKYGKDSCKVDNMELVVDEEVLMSVVNFEIMLAIMKKGMDEA